MVYRNRCNPPSETNPLHRMSMKKEHQLVLIVSSRLQEMRCRLVEVKYRTVRHPVRKSNPEMRGTHVSLLEKNIRQRNFNLLVLRQQRGQRHWETTTIKTVELAHAKFW